MSERDKFLTEAIGECYHETSFNEYDLCIEETWGTFIEKKCICGKTQRIGKRYSDADSQPLCSNIYFSTWIGYGKLWEWVQEQDFFDHFIWSTVPFQITIPALSGPPKKLYKFTPDSFADKLYKYLKETK